ncbi:hypothetical protein [Ornithinimicrobium sp. W1665]|uniref:hypothetical protein n=1 Tax=Ornithinimicrobium sp. W1665 TaxID=3416666 RepID=UPI003D6AB1C5
MARTAHRLALEQQVTRAYHDPDYVFGAELDPDAQPLPGAPVVDPCVPGAREVTYRASVIQLPLTYVDGDQANPQGWRDVQGRIIVADADVDAVLAGEIEPEPFFFRVNAGDCINFELTNRTPNWIGDDAYQELVATNMVGAHIHLVNFDVLASDGSSNGWNYQQAAFTEEQAAFTQGVLDGEIPCPEGASCVPVAPTDRDPVQQAEDARASWLSEGQTIKERWYADYELRTAFMHDHHFAGTLQNRGLFSALVVEGQGYDSRDPLTGEFLQPVNTEGRGVPVCGTSCVGTAHGSAMDPSAPRDRTTSASSASPSPTSSRSSSARPRTPTSSTAPTPSSRPWCRWRPRATTRAGWASTTAAHPCCCASSPVPVPVRSPTRRLRRRRGPSCGRPAGSTPPTPSARGSGATRRLPSSWPTVATTCASA